MLPTAQKKLLHKQNLKFQFSENPRNKKILENYEFHIEFM